MKRTLGTAVLASMAAVALVADTAPAQVTPSCPQTSAPITYDDSTLDTLTEYKLGTKYAVVASNGRIQLSNQGAFKPDGPPKGAVLGTAELFVAAASADFDRDGRIDFVAGLADGTTLVYRNLSYDPSPTWSDPNYVLPPTFQVSTALPVDAVNTSMRLAAGDFNGDGNPDIVRINISGAGVPQNGEIFLYTGNDGSGNPLFGTTYEAISAAEFASIGSMPGRGHNVVVSDVNGDGTRDLLIGSTSAGGGAIHNFLNNCTLVMPIPGGPPPWPCATPPAFSYSGDLMANLGMNSTSLPVFAYTDLDVDGVADLAVAASDCCTATAPRLRWWKGLGPGSIDTFSAQSLTFDGGAVFVIASDLSLDGRVDLLVGIDSDTPLAVPGGRAYLYANDGTATPFAAAPTQVSDTGAPFSDLDVALVFDYDNDPDGTPDLIAGDDTLASNYRVLAMRPNSLHVETGRAVSEIVDLGTLSTVEMVITAARLTVTQTIPNPPNDSIRWFVTNEDEPPNWIEALDCGDASGDLCATFPKPAGRQLRWKAELRRDPATPSVTPFVEQVVLKFDYTEASEHSIASVVVFDGVAYVGAFSQPGDRGKFYAFSADLNTLYWEAGAKLDAQPDSERRVFTWDGVSPGPVEFIWAGSGPLSSPLQSTIGGNLPWVVDWVRGLPPPRQGDGPRFGVDGQPRPKTKLGAIETSSPAVVGKPGLPIWYSFVSAAERSDVDTFISNNSDRPTLVLVGTKSGMMHAFRNDSTNIADLDNGKEAWSYIPKSVAGRMLLDHIFSHGTNPVLTVSAYPDGSPTVADVRVGGALKTVAIFGSGNGGKSLAAIDITDTVSPDFSSVTGPTPLWEATPGNSAAGNAFSKPTLIRVDIAGERFITVVGTGTDLAETPPYTHGKIVEARDAGTGALLWQFETMCPLTTDIVAFETDDVGEPGTPTIDGFIDRVVFADRCGYVYKLDPAQDLGGGWNINSDPGFGTIPAAAPAGNQLYALFSTVDTPGAIVPQAGDPDTSLERPIVGITVRADNSGTAALFFGTGGLADFDPAYHNAFYKVYVTDGSMRAKLTGTCSTALGPRHCEKFYGGVAATSEQVIVARSIDPVVGTGICDPGSSLVEGFGFEDNGAGAFNPAEFSQAYGAATASPLYAHGGAVYFVQQSGQVVRIGAPRSPNAGGDSATGGGGGMGGGGGGGALGSDRALTLLGWRQIF